MKLTGWEYPELCGFDLIRLVPQSQKAKVLPAIDEEPLLQSSARGKEEDRLRLHVTGQADARCGRGKASQTPKTFHIICQLSRHNDGLQKRDW